MGFRKLKIVLISFSQESFQNAPKFLQLVYGLTSFGILLGLFAFVSSCKNDPIKPDEDKPGRRDYEWTVDTVKVPFNYLSRISGSSPEDLWAVGPGGGLDETIWHFDGIEWKTDGISRGISPRSVFSFSKGDVWIAGHEGKIWHFDGNEWKQSLDFKKSNYTVGFADIWGDTPQNIYAVGYSDSANHKVAIILNFNGMEWKEKKITELPYEFTRIKKDIKGNGKYYLLGFDLDNNTSILEYDGGTNIKQIYKAPLTLETAAMVQNINSKTFFTIGKTINTYINNQFKMIFRTDEPNFGFQFSGRSEKDILLRMFDGIAHYNGSDIEYLYRFINNDRIDISDAIIFENDVFFLADDFNNNQNLFFRGRLK